MSEPAVQPLRPTQSLGANQALVVGRISDVQRTDNAVYTLIQSPAPDAYSHPGIHKVLSKKLLGKPGEDVQIKCRLAGFRRSYNDKHGEKVTTADNSLYAIEE